jgi:hypothetical protein
MSAFRIIDFSPSIEFMSQAWDDGYDRLLYSRGLRFESELLTDEDLNSRNLILCQAELQVQKKRKNIDLHSSTSGPTVRRIKLKLFFQLLWGVEVRCLYFCF